MQRRDFLALIGAMGSVAFPAYARKPATSVAVVIGVDKSVKLPPLSDAAKGAKRFSRWLSLQGFKVHEFIDDKKPVHLGPISDTVSTLVRNGNLKELLIYFSGHGFKVGNAEQWFLSNALNNPNESIALVESLDLARGSAIPNIYIVSDACRSTSDSLHVHKMHGGVLFTGDEPTGGVAIDRFYATLPGKVALELPVSESVEAFKGIFTATFLDAYSTSDRSMITTVDGEAVIENRSLKKYLVSEVRRRVERTTTKFKQQPECIVESDPPTYIGRVRIPSYDNPLPPVGKPPPSVANVASSELGNWGLWTHRAATDQYSTAELDTVAEQTGFNTFASAVRLASADNSKYAPVQFETQTGFVVFGAKVEAFRAINPSSRPELLEPGNDDDKPAILRTQTFSGSALIKFANGNGTVVAVLPGFIGRILVRDRGVVDVGYVPSRNTSRWLQDPDAVKNLGDLRSYVAAAAEQGVFRVEGDSSDRRANATELLRQIRLGKGVDPTLALYSAYAFADAGLTDEIQKLAGMAESDLGVPLFDIAMLAGKLRGQPVYPQGPVIPFCPMLSQGWRLLSNKGVKFQGPLADARDHLIAAPWTTFDPEGVSLISKVFP